MGITQDIGLSKDDGICLETGITQDTGVSKSSSDSPTLPASTIIDLDATQSGSYSGSGTDWVNLGSGGSDYNFVFGDGVTSTTYPTFNGTAGDSAAYFSLDGGDYFTPNDMSLCTLLEKAQRTDEDGGWFAIAFRYVDPGSGNDNLWGTGFAATDIGIYVNINHTTNNVAFRQTDGSNFVIETLYTAGVSDATDYLLIVSLKQDETTGNLRSWLNSLSKVEIDLALNTVTADTTELWAIGSSSGGSDPMPSGTRIYAFSAGDEFIDDSTAAEIFSIYESRHSRDYTP